MQPLLLFLSMQEGSFRIACQEGEVEIVRVFLRLEHFNVNAVKQVKTRYFFIRKCLLSLCLSVFIPFLLFVLFVQGRVTGLMLATNNKHVPVIEALLTHPEIDVNAQDNVSVVFVSEVSVLSSILVCVGQAVCW